MIKILAFSKDNNTKAILKKLQKSYAHNQLNKSLPKTNHQRIKLTIKSIDNLIKISK